MKTVFTYGGNNPYDAGFPALITLLQSDQKHGRFTLIYGMEITVNMQYAEACKKLGQAIMHHLACESLINYEGE